MRDDQPAAPPKPPSTARPEPSVPTETHIEPKLRESITGPESDANDPAVVAATQSERVDEIGRIVLPDAIGAETVADPTGAAANPDAEAAAPPTAEAASAKGAGSTPTDTEAAAFPTMAQQASVAGDEDVLEELTLPSLILPPEPLLAGTVIGPEGRLRIAEHLGTHGRINHYAAAWQGEDGKITETELREGLADHAGLRRDAEILGTVEYAMLPTLHATFEQDGRRYLAIDRFDGETLEDALRAGLSPDQGLSIVLQLVQAVRRLQRAGWALIGLSPADVRLGQPVCIAYLGHAARIGETLSGALHVAGYSAPELAYAGSVTGKEDVYTLGAILYGVLTGQALPETGAELAALPAKIQTPGVPQVLATALAPADERIDVEALYQGLLELKQRLAKVTVALEVASATSVGLNPTRPVNEDSCGYITWSVAVAEGVTYRAFLCVADGMGGMAAGEVASRTAVNVVLSAATSPLPLPPAEESDDPPIAAPPPIDPVALIRRAAPAVHAAARGRQVGTTVTCVAVHADELTLGHVGDTRAYLFHCGALTQLTVDHSLVAAMVTSGVISKEEARGHPDSNKVLRSLGSQRELPERYVDDLRAAYGQPSLGLEPGDWLVLCTDGVWGQVDDAEIQAIVTAAPDCPTLARTLIERALEAGAPDNAATVVARCVRMPIA